MKILISLLASVILGHGRLMQPPGRSSLRYYEDDPSVGPFWDQVEPNYNDNQLFCGGLQVQINNNYKCGLCGDDFNSKRPRDNELGGLFGKSGIIPRTYSSGSLMPIEVHITAHHQGFFEFRICKDLIKINGELTEDSDCFSTDDSLLELENGETQYSITDFKPTKPGESGWWYLFNVKLPNTECDHCVIQWRYHTANSWGIDENGSGLGHGYQEEFYGCADIEIINTSANPTDKPTTKPATTKTTTTSTKVSTTKATTTTTTKPTATEPVPTQPPNSSNPCEGQVSGYFPHSDCSKFYQCDQGKAIVRDCAPGLHYNQNIQGCDWPQNANCNTHF